MEDPPRPGQPDLAVGGPTPPPATIGLHRLPPLPRSSAAIRRPRSTSASSIRNRPGRRCCTGGWNWPSPLRPGRAAAACGAGLDDQRPWSHPTTATARALACATWPRIRRCCSIRALYPPHRGRAFAAEGLAVRLHMTTVMETLKMPAGVGPAWSVLPHTMLDASIRCCGWRGSRGGWPMSPTAAARCRMPRAFMALLDAAAKPGTA